MIQNPVQIKLFGKVVIMPVELDDLLFLMMRLKPRLVHTTRLADVIHLRSDHSGCANSLHASRSNACLSA